MSVTVPCPLHEGQYLVRGRDGWWPDLGRPGTPCTWACPDSLPEDMRAQSEEVTSTSGCHHAPPCPSGKHHDRLIFREADEWARSMVEGLADDGIRFRETLLADAPRLPPLRYFPIGDKRVARPGDIVFIHGKNAAGKSPTLDLIGQDHLRQDEDCLWILLDYELGAARERDRLLTAGFTREQIEESIYYVEFPTLLTDGSKDVLLQGVLDKAEKYGKAPRLITWDTFARSCSRMPGADPEKNAHINAWFTSHVDWAKQAFESITEAPLTQYITDHPNKGDGPTPGGGHAKQDRVVTNIWLKRLVGFSKHNEKGDSAYIVSKNGHGDYAIDEVIGHLRNAVDLSGSHFYTSSEDSGHVVVDLSNAKPSKNDRAKEKIRDALTEHGLLDRTAITGSGALAKFKREALDEMVADGEVEESPKPGTSTGRVYRLP